MAYSWDSQRLTYAEIEKTFSRSSAQSKQQKTKMENFNLCHTYWVCNYHVVWIHKYRKKNYSWQ